MQPLYIAPLVDCDEHDMADLGFENITERELEEEEEKICTEEDIYHNNFSLGYFEETLSSFTRDHCYFGGYNCRDCKKKFVDKLTPGNEEKECRPTERDPVHGCHCIKQRLKCEHAYCHPCFLPRLAGCGNTKDSPRKKRRVAVYNAGH